MSVITPTLISLAETIKLQGSAASWNLRKARTSRPPIWIQELLSIKLGVKKNYDKYSDIEILIHPGFTNKAEINLFNQKYFNYYSSIERRKEFNLCLSNKIKFFLKKQIYSNP